MLTLTLRSGRDGRFLARLVDRDGFTFVLDYGDRRIIQDASQRALKGFTMWRYGQLVTAAPQDPEFLGLMAEFYVNEGLLVFLQEPNWVARDAETHPPPIPGELGELGDDDLTTELAPAPPQPRR